jgi:hypothetical protein
MAYFIFLKNSDNILGTLYRISENQSDLNNLNIDKSNYKIIEDTQENFNAVKYGTKIIDKYNENIINYLNETIVFPTKKNLLDYITNFNKLIFLFLINNTNHPLYNRWNDYYNQLNSLDLDNIQYPLNKSLEQYLKDQNQTSLSPLQIP